jgi:hypothetical protein
LDRFCAEKEQEKRDQTPPKKAVKKLARKVVKRIPLDPLAKRVAKFSARRT